MRVTTGMAVTFVMVFLLGAAVLFFASGAPTLFSGLPSIQEVKAQVDQVAKASIAQNSISDCLELEVEVTAIEKRTGLRGQDVSFGDRIQQFPQRYCVDIHLKQDADAEDCQQLRDHAGYRYECAIQVASTESDSSLCHQIEYDLDRITCIAAIDNRPELCAALEDDSDEDQFAIAHCLSFTAYRHASNAACDLMPEAAAPWLPQCEAGVRAAKRNYPQPNLEL